MKAERYAIYLAPTEPEAFCRFGSSLLGYDAELGRDAPQALPRGFGAEEWTRWSREPRRYGFHATLKAPFRLAEGQTEDQLTRALREFARRRKPFAIALRPSLLGSFVALTLVAPNVEVAALESATLEAFEAFRAPLTDEELKRRLATPLNERQKDLLARYGYPYVKEEFRLHFTLSGNLPPELRQRTLAAIGEAYSSELGDRAIAIDDLALFKQENAAARFRIIARAPFGPAGSKRSTLGKGA